MDLTLSLFYGVARDILAFARGRRRVLSATEVVRLREKWQPIFEARIAERRAQGLREDVIVRDVKRVDNYPDIKEGERGISSWFRAGLVGTYHRGIQLALRYEGLCWDESTKHWRYCNYKPGEKSEISAAVIGLVRYENVESVNWDGDEYYGFPHLYCHFVERKRQPYERVAFFERKELDHREYYSEFADCEDVDRYSRKTKSGRYA